MSVVQALDWMLKGTGCGYRFVDDRAVVIFPLTTAPPAPAQTSAGVVVVATRLPTPITRSPYSVTKIDAATLRDWGVSETADLPPLVSGMTVTNLGPGRDKIFLRGLSDSALTGRSQSTVGLYLDDVVVSYDAPDPDLRLVDIAAVEVLRGPQGALYGAGPIAGVVQYQTNPPGLNLYEARVAAETGITEGGAPSRSVEGVLNMPVLPGRVGVRLVAYDGVMGGYITDALSHRQNINKTERMGLRATARFELSPAVSLSLGGLFQSLNSGDSQYDTSGLPPYQRTVRVSEPHDNDFEALFAQVRWSGRGLAFKSTTAVIRHVLDTRYDATDALASLAPAATGPAAYDETLHKRLLTQDTTLSSRDDRGLQWLVGAFYLRAAENDRSALTDLPVGVLDGLYREDRDSVEESYALYGEATRQLLPHLYLTLGARVFRTAADVDARVRASDGLRAVSLSQHTSGFAPKAVLRFDATPALTLYGQATEGYRGGGVNTAGLAGQPLPSGPPGVPPFLRYSGDQLWNYELGLRGELWNGAGQLHLAAFYDSWRNVQSDRLLTSGLPYTANLGLAINRGLEAEGALHVDALTVKMNLSWNNPELVAPGPGFASLKDVSLPAISRLAGGGAVSYRRRLTTGTVMHVGLDASYVDRSNVNLFATSTVMGGYITARALVSVEGSFWDLRLRIENLLGRPANTFAYGNPFSAPLREQITPQRPRTLSLRLAAHF